MKLVVDAVGVRAGSAAIVLGNLLRGWCEIAPQDDIVVLTDGPPHFDVPPSVSVERLVPASATLPARLWAQSVGVRRACHRLGADALLSAVTAGAFLGASCPRGAIVYDVRHELRPGQFRWRRRAARRALYGWTFRRADALFCISERTRQDLLATRSWLAGKAYAALLGVDHAASWRPHEAGPGRYVLAFGHFANKNLDGVLRAWARYEAGPGLTLRVCGLGRDARPAAEKLVAELGIGNRVELLGWLTDAEFEAGFAGAAAIVFPSDFEGFGLPAVEGLLLGIPVVISTDPALLEVSGGHAVVAADDRPETLAAAIDAALHRAPEQVAAGIAHARTLTWARMATTVRTVLAGAGGRHTVARSSPAAQTDRMPVKQNFRTRLKMTVAKAGVDSTRLDVLYNLAKVETWRREHVPADCPVFDRRTDMYRHLQREHIGDEPIDYLEFGVYEGGSMASWLELNPHPQSRFAGFDTFEGLPEHWRRIDDKMQRSAFDTGGAVPDLGDDRVEFVKGLFQDTLDDFLASFTRRSRLVVHCDADLYSSTLYTLTKCDDILVPGSIVIFDEFSSVLNEFAALADYCSAYRREYDVLAATSEYFAQIAIRMR